MDTNHTISRQKYPDLLSQPCPESRYDIHFTNAELIQYTLAILFIGYLSLRLLEGGAKYSYNKIQQCPINKKANNNTNYTSSNAQYSQLRNQEDNQTPKQTSSIMRFIRNLCRRK